MMEKRDMLKEIQNNTTMDFTQKEIDDVVNAFLEVIKQTLIYGPDRTFMLRGVGTLYAKDIPERTYSGNGITKDKTYTVPAHKSPKFRVSPSLKEQVENETTEGTANG